MKSELEGLIDKYGLVDLLMQLGQACRSKADRIRGQDEHLARMWLRLASQIEEAARKLSVE